MSTNRVVCGVCEQEMLERSTAECDLCCTPLCAHCAGNDVSQSCALCTEMMDAGEADLRGRVREYIYEYILREGKVEYRKLVLESALWAGCSPFSTAEYLLSLTSSPGPLKVFRSNETQQKLVGSKAEP